MRFRRRHRTDDLEDQTRAFSLAFVFAREDVVLDALEGVVRARGGEVWVDLRPANVWQILGLLGRGRGRLVVRCWYFFSRAGEKGRLKRRGEGGYDREAVLELRERIREVGRSSSAGSGASSRAGSCFGSRGSGAGSPLSSLRSDVGSPDSGPVRVRDDRVWRVCQTCHAGHACQKQLDGDVSALQLSQRLD